MALSAAISLLTRACDLTEQGNAARADRLSNLGVALADRFELRGDPGDLDTAIATHRRAVVSAAGRPAHALMLSNLAHAQLTRYQQRGRLVDLEAADENTRRALAVLHGRDSSDAYVQNNRAAVLLELFARSGNVSDAAAAVALLRQCVDDAGTSETRCTMLSNLGAARHIWAAATGDAGMLDEAVETHRDAVAATTRTADLASCLANLGSALRARHELAGRLVDLQEAISPLERAVGSTALADPAHARRSASLAITLAARYSRMRSAADLDTAIGMLADSADAVPRGHRDAAVHRRNLGVALTTRGVDGHRLEDLDRAIEVLHRAQREAAHLLPIWLDITASLGDALTEKYQLTGDDAALDRAVSEGAHALLRLYAHEQTHSQGQGPSVVADQLVARPFNCEVEPALSLPDDFEGPLSPDLVRLLAGHGEALLTRFNDRATPEDLAHARRALLAALESPSGRPVDRARAGFLAGHVIKRQGDISGAVATYAAALETLALIVPAWLGIRDAQDRQSDMLGAASEAAAAALDDDRPELAVEMLEQGRGLLMGYALHRSQNLDTLQQAAPALVPEFRRLGQMLNMPVRDEAAHVDASEARRLALEGLAELTAQARTVPGLADFAGPTRWESLAAELPPEPVVLVNVADDRCDALIISQRQIHVLPLRDLTAGEAQRQAAAFERAIADRNDYDAVDVLRWLWQVVVAPVLNHEALLSPPADHSGGTGGMGESSSTSAEAVRPRVHWCPTGPLVGLPFHAAGVHSDPDNASLGPLTGQSAMDAVVSSTTPTLQALARAHSAAARSAQQASTGAAAQPSHEGRALVVAMPSTPGLPPLDRAATDVGAVHAATGGRTTILDAGGPGSSRVATRSFLLAELTEHRWVHLACHAVMEPADPSSSRLLLTDHAIAPVTVADLVELRNEDTKWVGPDLAFLAACSTSGTAPDLADESIHLAGALRMLGARHVIATLWPVSDEAAALAASSFYSALDAERTHQPDWSAASSARALHEATRTLRERYPGRPSRWAAYVHWGP